eukprot:703708-Amphidinium_carterae.2
MMPEPAEVPFLEPFPVGNDEIQTTQLSRLRRGLHPQATRGHIEGMRQVSVDEAYAILRAAILQDHPSTRPDIQL